MKGKQNAANGQTNFLYQRLEDQLNPKHPLYKLGNKIDWENLDREFEGFYSEKGRPAHPIRLMVSLSMLKHMHDVSDEDVAARWVENPYRQFFSGSEFFQWRFPIDPSDLTYFRRRIGKDGAEKILKATIDVRERKTKDEEVLVDTTVHEKNITYPTDAELRKKAIDRRARIAEKEKIELRQSYKRKSKNSLRVASLRRTKKQKKEARKALKKLQTIGGRLVRELPRKTTKKQLTPYHGELLDVLRALYQKRGDKHKIYSLHEPQVLCIAKGKARKRYEFGSKASIAVASGSGIVAGALSFKENIYDGNALEAVKKQVVELTGEAPRVLIADRGYRGKKKIGATEISIPGIERGASPKRKKELRKRHRKRAGIEAYISHLKLDHRMARNYLKGTLGDEINVRMSAAAFNLMKRVRFFVRILSIILFRLKTNDRSYPICSGLLPA